MPYLQMLDDRVSVIAEEVKKNMIKTSSGRGSVEATETGIVIPEVAKEAAKYLIGIIENKGEKVSENLKKGDRVLIARGMGMEIPYNNKNLIIIRECDVLGKIGE